MQSGLTPDEQRRLASVEAKLELMQNLVEELGADIKAIRSTVDQAKGSWKVLLAAGGAGAALMEFGRHLATWFGGH